jgi:hypothetical protein
MHVMVKMCPLPDVSRLRFEQLLRDSLSIVDQGRDIMRFASTVSPKTESFRTCLCNLGITARIPALNSTACWQGSLPALSQF